MQSRWDFDLRTCWTSGWNGAPFPQRKGDCSSVNGLKTRIEGENMFIFPILQFVKSGTPEKLGQFPPWSISACDMPRSKTLKPNWSPAGASSFPRHMPNVLMSNPVKMMIASCEHAEWMWVGLLIYPVVNGGSDQKAGWGTHVPYLDALFHGEPVGATNRVSQSSNQLSIVIKKKGQSI